MPLPALADRATRARALALLAYAVFIAYQSLAAGGPWACGGEVLEMPTRIARGDLLVNIVAYVPLGALCLVAAWPSPRRRAAVAAAILGSVVAVSLCSLTLELAQACAPRRVSSMVDWLANSTGGVLGVVLGAVVMALRVPRVLPGLGLDAPRLRACTIGVALLWIGSETMPWVFSLDLGQARSHLRFLTRADPLAGLDAWRVARHAGAWLAIAASCRLVARTRAGAVVLIGLAALASVGLQLLVFARVPLSFAEFAGMALAVVPAAALVVAWRDTPASRVWPTLLATGVVVVLVAYELRPEPWQAPARGFGWWPRVGFGRPMDALEFAWLFGWAGLSVAVATEWATRMSPHVWARHWPVGIVLLVLALELAQAIVPGRSGDTSAVLFTAFAVVATRLALRDVG